MFCFLMQRDSPSSTRSDHSFPTTRSSDLIRRWIGGELKPGETAVRMGDFNSPATSKGYAAIVEPGQGALRDSRTASRTPHYGPLGTFTEIGRASCRERVCQYV